jgi:hypothetical protein
MNELHGASVDGPLELLDVDPVLLERYPDALGAQSLQQEQCPVVRRLLDDHPVPGRDQVLEQHRAGLERAVGDHDLRRIG